MLVEAPEPGELGRLERQRHQKADGERLPPRAAEIVAQVHAQRHQQQHVEERLVDVRVAQRGQPGGRIAWRERRFGQEPVHEVERHELRRLRVGHDGRAVFGQRQQYEEVRA